MRTIVIAFVAMSLAGCERGMHDMYDQHRYKPLAGSPVFADGRAERPRPDGTVVASRGAVAGTSSGRAGDVPLVDEPPTIVAVDASGKPRDVDGATLQAMPAPTAASLARGRERYGIYCTPCHSVVGDGDGMVVRRGFPRPSSFHTDRLRAAPDAYFYSVITHGYGVMYPFGDRIAPADRWAIVAYLRALQTSGRTAATEAAR